MKFPLSSSFHKVLPPLLLLAFSLLLYFKTFAGIWLMDDYPVIVNNSDIRSINNFLINNFPGRPLREMTYLVDYYFFGLDPWGYHFQNIIWHSLNCWLIYLTAIKLNLSRTVAWLSSLLFLVHPLHVEVVANSSHRKDSLALFFMLLALLAFTKIYDQKIITQCLYWLVFSFIFWIIAFFAKGNALIFPAIVMAYDYAIIPIEKRLIFKRRSIVPVISCTAPFALIAWYWYITSLPSFKIAIIGIFVKTENLSAFTTEKYVLIVLKSISFMFSKLILPMNLSMEYIYSVPESFLDLWVVSAILIFISFILIAFWAYKKSPEVFFLLLMLAFLWLPTSNIVWPFAYFAADRYMYAPSAPLLMLVVFFSEKLFISSRRYFIILWLSILCIFSFLSWQQTAVWHDDYTLYSNMLRVSPRSLEAMIGLANSYYINKDYEISSKYATLAMERDFTDFRPYLILGNINFIHGRLNEALQLMLEAQKKNKSAPEIYNALGSVYDDLGKTTEAIDSFKTAIKLRPDYLAAYTNMGVAYERLNDLSDAEYALNKAIEIDYKDISSWYNLGILRYKKADPQGAIAAFLETLKLDPNHFDAATNLSIICKEYGNQSCYQYAATRLNQIRQKN